MNRRRIVAAVAAFALGTAGAVAVAVPAHAAEIEVTSEADAGMGSLRDAIASANTGDTIVFSDAVTEILLVDTIEITDGITIDGGGDVTIGRSGANDFTQLSFAPDAADQDIVIQNITLEGSAGSTGSAFSATNANGFAPGDVTVRNVTVRDQTASYAPIGELFQVAGAILVEDSQFLDNESTGGDGGLYVNSGTPASIRIVGSRFEGNETAGDGGALAFDNLGTAPEIVASSFFGNSAVGRGGAVVLNDVPGVLVEGDGDDTVFDFEGNHADEDGGAIALSGSSGSSTFRDVDFLDNDALQAGGAIYAGNVDGSILIERVNADDNDSDQDGGAFYLNADTSATISDVRVEGSDASRFGGVAYVATPAFTVALSLFANNSADVGGAFYLNGSSSPQLIRDSTFSRNDAGVGGAVYTYIGDSTLTFARNTFSQNESTTGGAAISIDEIDIEGTLVIDSTTFSGQTIDQAGQPGPGFAASVYIEEIEGEVDIVNSTFDESIATASAVVFDDVDDGASTMVRHSTMRGGASVMYGNLADAEHAIENTILEALGPAAIVVDDPTGSPVQLRYSIVSTGIPAGVTNAQGNHLATDPLLGSLQHNGGTGTMYTRLPEEGSPAIDMGDPALDLVTAPEFDERGTGFPRIQNNRVDIGAVEVPATLSTTGGEFPWAAAVIGLLALGFGAIALALTRRRAT